MLVQREEVGEEFVEVVVVGEPNDGPGDRDALPVGESDVKAASQVNAFPSDVSAPSDLKFAGLVVGRRLGCISFPTTTERLACAHILHAGVRYSESAKNCCNAIVTNLDVIVRPPNDLTVKSSQCETELAFAHNLLAGVLANISLQMLDF